MVIRLVRSRPLLADCTDINFLGLPTYAYGHDSSEEGIRGAFSFRSKGLSLPFSFPHVSVSDRTHTQSASLFLLREQVVISSGLCSRVVPGPSFRTSEKVVKMLSLGSQTVCVTPQIVYFLPNYFVVLDYTDVDSSDELYVLKKNRIEIYSTKVESFAVEDASFIRCTKSPRVVVLATNTDVFLVDLARETAKHLAYVSGHIHSIVYDNEIPLGAQNSEGGGLSHRDCGVDGTPQDDIVTSISNTEVLLEALNPGKRCEGSENLYMIHGHRLTLLCISTLRTKSVSLPYRFKLHVSRDYVVLTRLKTFLFFSKDLERCTSMQLDFKGFDCQGGVLGFVKDDLVIFNGRKYIFKTGSGWEYVTSFFRRYGYHKLRELYTEEDYEDDEWAVENRDAVRGFMEAGCKCAGRGCCGGAFGARSSQRSCLACRKEVACIEGYLADFAPARGGCRGRRAEMQGKKTQKRPLKPYVMELKSELDLLEAIYDRSLIALEGKKCPTAHKKANSGVNKLEVEDPEILKMVKADYEELYGKKKEEKTDTEDDIVVKKYSSVARRRGGF